MMPVVCAAALPLPRNPSAATASAIQRRLGGEWSSNAYGDVDRLLCISETTAPGTKDGPNRHLSRASGRPRESRAREVHACDEQHDDNRAEQKAQIRRYRSDDRVTKTSDLSTDSRIVIGILALEPFGDALHLRLGVRDRDARRKPADRLVVVAVAAHFLVLRLERDPDICTGGIAEVARHHTDRGVRRAKGLKMSSREIATSAELLLPELVADDADRRSVLYAFLRKEGAAEHRSTLEETKVVG